MCQTYHIRLSLSLYSIKIQTPITREGIPVRKGLINLSVCTSVMSVFKTSGRKGHSLSYAGTKSITKRMFGYQNKERTKELLKTCEYATRNRLTYFEILTFFLKVCFYVVVLKSVSNRYVLNHFCVYSC